MKITVECCGASSRWLGAERLLVELADGARAGDALTLLAARSPELARRVEGVALALGDRVVSRAQLLNDMQTLALIPPVSGG